MEQYIKDIQVNNNSVTAIDNCNNIVTWLSSIITEIEEVSGAVVINKADGTNITIPIDAGVTTSELNGRLNQYYDKFEVDDLIRDIKLEFDKYVSDDRLRRIIDINSGSGCGSCDDSCGGGCGCGINTCCLNFLTAFVDNRETCGGITLIDNMGHQINILEYLEVYDIEEVTTGTFHVTKCDDEFDIVVGDKIINNGDGSYTVNPGDDREDYTIEPTQVIDNGDGTYTFINFDGNEFTLDLAILPTINKRLIYDNVNKVPWYPTEGELTHAIPVPGYALLDFQNIDVTWSDVDVSVTPHKQGNAQLVQYSHNGRLMVDGIDHSELTDIVGSYGAGTTVWPYTYTIKDDYSIFGMTQPEATTLDVGLNKITVSHALPLIDLTNATKFVDNMNNKQRSLVFKTASSDVNAVYQIWIDVDKYDYRVHIEAAQLLTEYLNSEGSGTMYDKMRTLVASNLVEA